jgi:hypothetical protein
VGNDVEHSIVTTAASGGAVGNVFNMLKCFQYIRKGFVLVKRGYNVVVANLHAVANECIFHNQPLIFQSNGLKDLQKLWRGELHREESREQN